MTSRARFVTGGFKKNTGLLNLSVSKMKTFDDCQLKFRFSYIERLPRKEWEHLVFGNLLHGALEKFHKFLIEGSTEPLHIIMSKAFNLTLDEFKNKATLVQKKEAWDLLNVYLQKFAEERKMGILPTFLDVEKNFFINIDDRVLLNGFIDRIQLDQDGLMHVSDYKTTKKKDYLKKDKFQLLTYAYVLFLEDPSLQTIRTSYILLRHDFDIMAQEITREEAMQVEGKFLEYADRIENEKLYRPNPTPLCEYCDYLSRCRDGQRFVDSRDDKKRKTGLVDWS